MTQWQALGIIALFMIVFYIFDYFVWNHKRKITCREHLHELREQIYFKALERLANPISFTGEEHTQMTLELRQRIEYAYDTLNNFRYASCANCINGICKRKPKERPNWELCLWHVSSQTKQEEEI